MYRALFGMREGKKKKVKIIDVTGLYECQYQRCSRKKRETDQERELKTIKYC